MSRLLRVAPMVFALAMSRVAGAQTFELGVGGEAIFTTGSVLPSHGFGGGLLLEERVLKGQWGFGLWQDGQTPISLNNGAPLAPDYLPTDLGLKADWACWGLRWSFGLVGAAYWHLLNEAESAGLARSLWAGGGTIGCDVPLSENFRLGLGVRVLTGFNPVESGIANRPWFLSFAVTVVVNS